MARIAVIGPGAIGGTLAAWLQTDEEHELMFGARTPFPELIVKTPSRELRSVPRFLEIGAMRESVDWILFVTKAYDSESAARWIPVLANPDTQVAVLQNGVEHLRFFQGKVNADKLLPVVVECPAERNAPGVIIQRRHAELFVPSCPAGKAFQSLFQVTEVSVEVVSDFELRAWRKLCLNAAGVVSALTLQPAGVVHKGEIADLMRGIIREGIQVANAQGIALQESVVEEIIEQYRDTDSESINSLHADRLAGRPMEVDARNGVIVRLGKKFKIATPLNEMAVALLRHSASVNVSSY